MRGGRSCFAMDSKSFEISVDVFGEKLKGIIMERSRGFTSWIKFGGLSLCCLMEGVEVCCKGEFAKRFVKSWEDGGRKFRLECHANEAGKFILCSVVDSEAKKYCLVFPEGKGILGESKVGAPEEKAKESFADVVKSRARKPDGDDFGLQMGLRPPMPHHAKITDEALMEEASRALITTGRGSNRGCVSEANRLAVLDPLRVILADGRKAEGFGFSSKKLWAVEDMTKDFSKRTI
ncbi:hypothetical protein CK203_037069 [Vitis vinifera]|uniref:Uncharacterized protein n=1 Tax=Vitis vinifera TaxID=29760 RepID=A0A438I5T6_VITVI|nr:hypothetical protein CK203_037069 [Vitis vinifera]